MSKLEILRSAMWGFLFGTLYFSGVPLELLLLLGALLFVFVKFSRKIRPIIDNFFNNNTFFSKVPIQFRPFLTLIVIFIILIVVKQIVYFGLSYFFGINFNFEEYLNTTEIN